MKSKLYNITILCLTIFVGISSCTKDDNTADDNNSGDFYFNVKIDDESFSGDLSDTEKFYAFKSHGTMLTINLGKDDSDPSKGRFFINVLDYKGPQSYEVSATAVYAIRVTPVLDAEWIATNESPGTVIVSVDKNNVVEGTFSFNGFNKIDKTTKYFTEGKFRLKVKP